jgi:hypothetical protein
MTATDLREEAVALRDALALLRTPPPTGGKDQALHVAWKSIVEPNLAALTGAADVLSDASAWILDEDDRAVRLKADRWDAALAQLANLYAALADTLARYRSLRVEWGVPPEPRAKGGAKPKKSAKAGKGRGEAKPAAEVDIPDEDLEAGPPPEALAALAEGITQSLEGQRMFLRALMKSVQTLVANMQKSEETWLRPDCEMCFVGNPDRALMADDLFEKMRVGRLNAESFHGEPSGRYAALVEEGWRAHHRTLLALGVDSRSPSLPPAPPPPPPQG